MTHDPAKEIDKIKTEYEDKTIKRKHLIEFPTEPKLGDTVIDVESSKLYLCVGRIDGEWRWVDMEM